jgi:YfiH family protein
MALPEVRRVLERPVSEVRALQHPEWSDSFPWLIQGTTTRGAPDRPFDFALFDTATDADVARSHWEALRASVGARTVVHARQVHGAEVRWYGDAARHAGGAERVGGGGYPGGGPPPHLADPCDGHATTERSVLLAVTTADCVPVFLVDPRRRAVAIAHAGWRGVAAGVLERALEVLARPGSPGAPHPAPRGQDLHVHFGPAICGSCYEVGPEVFRGLGLPAPGRPSPLDLRAVLAERAIASGVPSTRITISEHCTRCTDSGLFSHRGGDAARQVGYLGLRP